MASTFLAVYGIDTEQKLVYEETAAPLVVDVLKGYNGTIFAYGQVRVYCYFVIMRNKKGEKLIKYHPFFVSQTGAGKTFTMDGVDGDEKLRGIMGRSFLHVFDAVKGPLASFLQRENLTRWGI